MHFFETPAIPVLCLAAILVALLVFLNLYLLMRNEFYIRVNCWFCNGWTKVAYQNRNSFNCSSCSQYNGFKEDGSYNKVIEAQHNTSLTKYATQKTVNYANGLCTYCNNNQQLKIYQLAKFTPISEDNYNVEIEHFQTQLEKVYKLCKKCEKVLKSTIDRQHSWLFGKRIRDLRKIGSAMMNIKKLTEVENSYFLRIIRYFLITLTIFILCIILKVEIVYPNLDLNQYLPTNVFSMHKIVLLDFYNTVLHSVKHFSKEVESVNISLPGVTGIQINTLTGLTLMGTVMDLLLTLEQNRTLLGTINGLFAWCLLMSTSSISIRSSLTSYVFSIQVLTSLSLFIYYLWFLPIEISRKKGKYQFKKLSQANNTAETSEEETDEEIPNLLQNIDAKSSWTSPKMSHPYSPGSPTMKMNLTNGFSTAKSVTSTSDLYNFSSSSGTDLNSSLDSLHLTNLSFKSQRQTSMSSPTRPLLSPSRLKNITQNPWTAGGFWKNDINVHATTVESPNLSRSSSQSSGFVSTADNANGNLFGSGPVSREASLAGDIDRVSILSEPAYQFSPINHTPTTLDSVKNPRLYYKADNNTFYPVLTQNNMLFIQNGIPHQSFGNLFLRSFNTGAKSVSPPSIFSERPVVSPSLFSEKSLIPPSIFSEKPVSPLFKNIHSDSFSRPQL